MLCYKKAVEIVNELRKDSTLFVCDPHEAITTYSTYFTILPAGITLVDSEDGRGRIEWNRPLSERWCLEVRVSDHKKGHALDFTAGCDVEKSLARIQKHIMKQKIGVNCNAR